MNTRSAFYNSYRAVRRHLERVPPFRKMIVSAVELKRTLLDSSARDRAAVEQFYASAEDPFGFDRDLERFRYRRAMELIDQAAGRDTRFKDALEVGCAEGMFTKLIAERCDRVVALDLSQTAIDRAKVRCKGIAKIDFRVWDVRQEPIEGTYDLIVATGVLEYIYRPKTLKHACDKIVRAMRPGAILLLGNTVSEFESEKTWLGKQLIRATLINDYVANDSRLESLGRSLDQCVCPFEHIVLRRRRD